MTDGTASSTDDHPQQHQEPRQLSRAELKRQGLPPDWNERVRSSDGIQHRGQTYGRRR